MGIYGIEERDMGADPPPSPADDPPRAYMRSSGVPVCLIDSLFDRPRRSCLCQIACWSDDSEPVRDIGICGSSSGGDPDVSFAGLCG